MTVSNDTPSPWLSIVGIGEDGLDGLSVAARELLANADLIVGGRRHLALVASLGRPTLEWEVPFAASFQNCLGIAAGTWSHCALAIPSGTARAP